ncbi:ADP-heptose synthase [Paenibacillus sp. SAF-054]|uniref:ADP-heptose synthase n=1 Tax=unclassified Paenibacillus TaxID=185978 RepID=UPI003F7EC6FF
MSRQFVTEAVMLAIYGELLLTPVPVEYMIPYTSLLELYEFLSSDEPLMSNDEDDKHVKAKVRELVDYLDEPLNKKKIQKALNMPWAKSPYILIGESARVTVVNAMDTAPYGELFDPVETELLLVSQREQTPLLTDQPELIHRIIDAAVPVQVFDIDDFQFAVESDHFTHHI